tara:strand:+ start:3698 stop:4414 length:717 start_codon:yes stop_codon:yes gene_type:complete
MIQKLNHNNLKYLFLCLFAIALFLIYKIVDINFIGKLFENNNLLPSSIYSIIILFVLRSFSIIIPIIPGTYCSIIAGYLYGIKNGLVLIFIADFVACSLSFSLSRRLGRNFVGKLLGQRQMKSVENISQKYLENNFFLMTGLLLTSWFDFVCYAVGLTKISWKKFMPALIFSIILSDMPFVAAGKALKAFNDVNLQKILKGEVDLFFGNYLILFIASAIIIFGIGLLNIFFRKKMKNI